MTALLKLEGLTKAYPGVVANDDVSFEIRKGEVHALLGENGAGKSTLVKMIYGLVKPDRGQMEFDGAPFAPVEPRAARATGVAMVFQHFGLLPHRTVIDNIMFGLEVRGESHAERAEKAMHALELVGLGGWDKNYPRELSGGMQQRVGLARAMAVDPEILIFDEPFSALDPLIRREMQDELLRLQAELKKTMVFITHDFLEAIIQNCV